MRSWSRRSPGAGIDVEGQRGPQLTVRVARGSSDRARRTRGVFTAFNAWTRDKTRSMAEILVDQGVLDGARRTLLEGLVAEHLKMHGGDPEKSLAAIDTGRSTRERLAQISDAELAPASLLSANRRPAEVLLANPSPGPAIAPSSARTACGHNRQEQLLAEQVARWGQGRRVLVEAFLARDPELRHDSEAVLDLIYNEIVLREQRARRPGADEYIGRFPELGDAIRDQFEIHRMFADRDPSSNGETPRRRRLSPSARPRPGACGFASSGRTPRGASERSSSRSTPSCTARWRSSRSTTEHADDPDQPPAIPGRGRDHRRPRASRHRAGLRPGHLRERPAVLRHAVHQGRQPQRRDRARFTPIESLKRDPGRRSLELQKLLAAVPRRLQRDRVRAQPRRAAPRLQAGQHHRRQARRDARRRLGPGQVGGPSRARRGVRGANA